jgi:hypothetical protein
VGKEKMEKGQQTEDNSSEMNDQLNSDLALAMMLQEEENNKIYSSTSKKTK